jgi:4-amino-4-deoxy-L-arabinose transferase-like glycosyltransferase
MNTTSTEATWPLSSRQGRRFALDVRSLAQSAPLAGLLLLTGVLYLWALSSNGYANQYYAAAVQAGTHSWKAFLFGSLDASNYITVDKSPASLWLMELSARVFGFSSFSMLLPQALEGVASVALLYATVRRWFGRPASLLSGLIFAITPVAALMFRFNNPDALLVLLFVLAAYSVTRALEDGATRWLVIAGVALGLGFLTKEMAALLVLPAFALVYLIAAPVPLRRRVWQLALAGAALVVSAGWWVALIELWPASARPYIGGSSDNNILQLIFGYNGFGRIGGGAMGGQPGGGAPAGAAPLDGLALGGGGGGGGPGGGGPGGGFSGTPGVLRLFNSQLGGQISWLLPAATIVLVSGAAWTMRRPRADRFRGALVLWGGWLIVTGAVFSFMSGVIHPYYTNALAPPIAVLIGVGATLLWRRRDQRTARLILAAMVAATGAWSFALLDRTTHWHPWLRFAILACAIAAATAFVVTRVRLRPAIAAVALASALAAPFAYTLSTVSAAQGGQNPSAGPAAAQPRRFASGGRDLGTTVNRALVSLLDSGSSGYRWVAASSSWQTAASAQLSSGKPVMAIGGFSGVDGMTLARFERLVTQHKLHYYLSGGGSLLGGSFPGAGRFPGNGPAGSALPGGPGRSQAASQIQSWVAAHFKAQPVGEVTVYDLSQAR